MAGHEELRTLDQTGGIDTGVRGQDARTNQLARESRDPGPTKARLHPAADPVVTLLVPEIHTQEGLVEPAGAGVRLTQLQLTGKVRGGQIPEAQVSIQVA